MSAEAQVDVGADGAQYALRIRGGGKAFGRTKVLSDIHLELAPGRFLVLLGPSGSGKSTLARIIAGVEEIDEGVVEIGGKVVGGQGKQVPPERRDLAMVFQDYALWPHLTAAQNIAFALRRRKLGAAETASRVERMLVRVGLDGMGSRYPNELSGGQQQRVALARALVADPSLVVFDEPLSNLDADLREKLRVEIATLVAESGASAVYITHDQSEAFALADEIAVLDRGRVVQVGSPEEIYHRPATPFVARFTGLSGRVAGTVVADTDGYVDVSSNGHRLAAVAIGGDLDMEPVDVHVRQAALSLRPAGVAHDGESSDERVEVRRSSLPGTVVDIAYRGASYDHVIDTPLGRFTSVHDRKAWPKGERCTLVIDAAGAFAFPLEDDR
ncbi:ABC transporter ATP-binding protein [Humibacter soli]